jgi:glycosyltransferase involved in cell wall biosynthesis
MTRVLVDLLFYTGRKGGMESYVREVYRRIADAAPELEFVGLASRELVDGDTSWFPGEVIDSGISGENRVAWAFGELFRVGGFARRLRADLVHCPANLGPIASRVPVLLTVHDLLPFRHPEYVPGRYAAVLRALVRLAARTARRVVTISQSTAADIARHLAVPSDRISVVPQGVAAGIRPAPVQRRPDQLLAVGNRMPHKNVELLLRALALMPEATRPRLIINGSRDGDPLAPVVAELALEPWVTLLGWQSDAELDLLYRQSTLVVFPTLFEGFGLPVLEAMARGCPVACSDIPVLHEVAGDSAVYFDPTDAAALAATLQSTLADTGLLQQLSSDGIARAAEYSWEQTAAGTAAALRQTR